MKMVLGIEEVELVSMVQFSVEFVRTAPAYKHSESRLRAGGPMLLGVGRDSFSTRGLSPTTLNYTSVAVFVLLLQMR